MTDPAPSDPDSAESAPLRTYSGWKVGLVVIAAIVVVGLVVNLVGDRTAPRPTDRPPPQIVSVTPAP